MSYHIISYHISFHIMLLSISSTCSIDKHFSWWRTRYMIVCGDIYMAYMACRICIPHSAESSVCGLIATGRPNIAEFKCLFALRLNALSKNSRVADDLANLSLMLHIRVSESRQHCFRWWLVAYLVSSHYRNQCWVIFNWTRRNKIQWNFDKNTVYYSRKIILKYR